MTIYGYVREISTSPRISAQKEMLFARGCETIVEETDYLTERRGLARLRGSCRKGDVLVVHSLPLLGGTLREILRTVSALEEAGVVLHTIDPKTTIGGRGGKGTATLVRALLLAERDCAWARMDAGANNRAERTRGRPVTTDYARIHEMRSRGVSVKEIAQALGCSPGTVHRAIRLGAVGRAIRD